MPDLHSGSLMLMVDEACVFAPPSKLQVPDTSLSGTDSALSAPDSDDGSSDDSSESSSPTYSGDVTQSSPSYSGDIPRPCPPYAGNIPKPTLAKVKIKFMLMVFDWKVELFLHLHQYVLGTICFEHPKYIQKLLFHISLFWTSIVFCWNSI